MLWGPRSSAITVIAEEVPNQADFRWESCDDGDYADALGLLTLPNLAKLLTGWPDCPEEQADGGRGAFIDYPTFGQLQTLAVEFYVRRFVKHFGRLPVPAIGHPYKVVIL